MSERAGYVFDGHLGSAKLLEAQIRAGLVFPKQMAEYMAKHPPLPVPVKPKPRVARPRVPAVIAPPARKMGSRVVEHVAKRSGIQVAEITGRDQCARLVAARRRVSRVMRRLGCSWCEIGRALERDHSTIIHYLALPERRG